VSKSAPRRKKKETYSWLFFKERFLLSWCWRRKTCAGVDVEKEGMTLRGWLGGRKRRRIQRPFGIFVFFCSGGKGKRLVSAPGSCCGWAKERDRIGNNRLGEGEEVVHPGGSVSSSPSRRIKLLRSRSGARDKKKKVWVRRRRRACREGVDASTSSTY